MVAAGLEYDVLRLTIAANYGHGTKITGERATKRRRYLKQYVEKQCTEWFEDLAEEIRLDRRLELSDVDHVNVKNKSWFGILNVLALMIQDWSILRAASEAILEESNGNAARALGSSMSTVCKILTTQSHTDLCYEMRVSPRCTPPAAYDALQEDVVLVEKASRFAGELAGSFAWSEQFPQMTLPLAAASLLAADEEARKRGMKHLKSLVSAIVKAEQLAPQRPDLQDLLTTLAFQEETLAREIMVYLQLADFDLDSDHTRECQRVMTEFCSGSSSTKDILESTFAHLAYVAGASNKNKRVSNFAAWFYAAASPYVQEFLVFDPDAEAHFLHNFTISDAGTWKYVHHRVLPPAALPEDLPADIAVAFEVLKRDESLLRGGLLAGISLTLPRLHQVMASIQCPKPSKGTGKNGRIKKIDLVTALVKHLWPDETNEFIKETVNKVMGSGLPEDVDLSVLSMVSELDTANQESFSKMKDQARKKLDTVLYGKGRLSGIRDAKKHDDCGGDAKAAESKVDAQAAKRAKKAEENHLAHEKSEKLRPTNQKLEEHIATLNL
ncbi:unnamed protein product [Durusdinium trenchii]|uniref:Uncharacterized protein n=1 Tax=Durusdinium trenchii TaxID=1381693 RepID=A0ABP0K4H3_9DINO